MCSIKKTDMLAPNIVSGSSLPRCEIRHIMFTSLVIPIRAKARQICNTVTSCTQYSSYIIDDDYSLESHCYMRIIEKRLPLCPVNTASRHLNNIYDNSFVNRSAKYIFRINNLIICLSRSKSHEFVTTTSVALQQNNGVNQMKLPCSRYKLCEWIILSSKINLLSECFGTNIMFILQAEQHRQHNIKHFYCATILGRLKLAGTPKQSSGDQRSPALQNNPRETNARRRSKTILGRPTLAGTPKQSSGDQRSPALQNNPRETNARRHSKTILGRPTLAGTPKQSSGDQRSPALQNNPRETNARRHSKTILGRPTLAGAPKQSSGDQRSLALQNNPRETNARRRSKTILGRPTLAGTPKQSSGDQRSPALQNNPRETNARRHSKTILGRPTLAGTPKQSSGDQRSPALQNNPRETNARRHSKTKEVRQFLIG